MNHDGVNCRYCDRRFKFKDLCALHATTCKLSSRSKKQHDRDTDLHETLPSQQEQFKLIQHLMLKVQSMESEILQLKSQTMTRKRKVILEWLNSQSGPKPATPFNLWCKVTNVTFDHLQGVFNLDITEGMKLSLHDYFTNNNTPIPVCAFTQKPGTIYIWSYTDDEPASIKWRTLDSITYSKWIDRIAHRFLETFVKWQHENAQIIRATDEDKQENISNMRKINGCGHNYEERRRGELRKWIFSRITQDFIHNVEYECV